MVEKKKTINKEPKEKKTPKDSIVKRMPPYLQDQVVVSIDAIYGKMKEREMGRKSKKKKQGGSEEGSAKESLMNTYHEWLKKFALDFFATRYKRAKELSSPEVGRARELANAYIGAENHDFFCTCMDGRNIPVVMFSKVPHVGGVLRTPAGKLDGFSINGDGSIHIDYESLVIQQIIKLLTSEKRVGHKMYYGLDSHFGCAARLKTDIRQGANFDDKGLYSDIQEKYLTAMGLLQLRAELVQQGIPCAEIVPTFFSYQSATGYVTMGLEANLNDPLVLDHGFTCDDPHADQSASVLVTDILAADGKIVRAEDLIRDQVIVDALKSVREFITPKSADFRENYGESLLHNWQAITKIYDDGNSPAFHHILDKLVHAYKNSGWIVNENENEDDLLNDQISINTLKQKAKFMLKNIVTRYSVAGLESEWPFDIHREVLGVITDGGYGPFPETDGGIEMDAFSIFSKDHNALRETTLLVIDLIRGSRARGTARNPYPDMVRNGKPHNIAPVMIVNKAIVRIESRTWDLLSTIDFSKLTKDIVWNTKKTFTRTEVADLLKKTAPLMMEKINAKDWELIIDGVGEILQRMAILSKEDLYTMMLTGQLAVVNTLLDADRRPRIVLPIAV